MVQIKEISQDGSGRNFTHTEEIIDGGRQDRKRERKRRKEREGGGLSRGRRVSGPPSESISQHIK